MKNCKICGDQTKNVFNIDFSAVPICEGCANAIFLQQATWYVKEGWKNRKIEPKGGFCTCDLGGEGNDFASCGICGKPYNK